jgi:hypothetical protein
MLFGWILIRGKFNNGSYRKCSLEKLIPMTYIHNQFNGHTGPFLYTYNIFNVHVTYF